MPQTTFLDFLAASKGFVLMSAILWGAFFISVYEFGMAACIDLAKSWMKRHNNKTKGDNQP